MPVTLDLPAEAQARLEAEAARRGITLDQLIVALAADLPGDAPPARTHRLSFVAIGASGRTEPSDIHRERAEPRTRFAEGV